MLALAEAGRRRVALKMLAPAISIRPWSLLL